MKLFVWSCHELVLVIIGLLISNVSFADQPPEISTVTFPQGFIVNGAVTNSEILPNASVTDALGNTYVTGSFMGQATFGTNILTSSGGFASDDVYLVKYDPTGKVVWARRAGGSGKDFGRAVVLDGAGGVYLGGTSDSQPFTIGSSSTYFFGKTMFIARYDGNGTLLWMEHGGSTGLPAATMTVNALARDSANNVIVGGSFNGRPYITGSAGAVTLTNKNLAVPTSAEDLFLAKFGPSGALLWATNYGGTNTEFASSIAVDSTDAIYAAGGFEINTELGGQVYTNLTAGIILAKFSSAGNLVWASNLSDATNSNPGRGWSVVVDSADRVIMSVQGNTSSKPFVFRGNSFELAFGSIGLMGQFTADGNLVWLKQQPFSGGASTLALDKGNNIYLGSNAGLVDGSATSLSLSIAKYNSSGSPLWTNTIPKSTITLAVPSISIDDFSIAHVSTTLSGGESASLAVGWTNIFPFTAFGYNQLLFTLASNFVAVPPVFVQQPTNMFFQPPKGLTNSAQARAWPAPRYYWYMNTSKIANQTNFTLALSSTGPTNRTTYFVVASNAFGMSTSTVVNAEVQLGFVTPPPTNIFVLVNTTLAIAGSATGTTAIAYQWRLNGTNLPGANSPALALPNIATNQAGNYTLVISNATGMLTSAPPSSVTVVQPGFSDPGFTNTLTGALDLLRDNDGGYFVAAASSVYHLNSSAKPDLTGPWAGGTGAGAWVLARESDTQFAIAGMVLGGVVRLNTNGTTDLTFSTGTGPANTLEGASFNRINSLVRLSNGQYLVGGRFNSFNGVGVTNLVRLNSNGSLDLTFPKHALRYSSTPSQGFGEILRLALQADGKILVGGEFGFFDDLSVSNLVRLNANGSVDSTFGADPIFRQPPFGRIHAILPLPDGKLLIGGAWGNATNAGIVRLNTNGLLDTSFSPPPSTAPTHAIAFVQNKLLVGGQNFLKRLSSDGVQDPTFVVGTAYNSSQTEAIIPEPSGNIVVCGTYGVRRLWLEPVPLTMPTFSSGGLAIVDGKFQLSACGGVDGQSIIVQASANLSSWTNISTNVVSGGCINFQDQQSLLFPNRYYRLTLP